MIALVHLLSILHLSIAMPFQYLARKSHEFKKYGWGAVDMGQVIGTLHKKLLEIQMNPHLIIDRLFMIDIFKQYQDKLPPFSDYWELMFKKKQIKVVPRKDGSKVTHHARLLKNLFSPHREADIGTGQRGYMSWDQ
jgi:hypothetical protein